MKTNKHLTTFLSELPENIPLPDIEPFTDCVTFLWQNNEKIIEISEKEFTRDSITFTIFTTQYGSVIGCSIYRMFNKPCFYEEIDDYVIGKLIGMLNDLFTS